MKKRFYTSLTILALTYFFAVPLFAQSESKVAVLTVTGSGKTQDEAKKNALRNAIEQAFGTFISSNTQILNDELVKDEIVSVSSGNIQEYTVLSEVQTPDGYWSNTVKAKVALDKLTSFCEGKGVNVEFKGSLFSLNIKQQILNEQNELKSIQNMHNVLKEFFNHSFNYTLSANQPISNGGNRWKVPIIIEGNLNNNINNASDYFYKTLIGISCTQSEIDTYNSLGKKLYYLVFKPISGKGGLFVLRNSGSLKEIIYLLDDLRMAFMNFTIENGIDLLDMSNYPRYSRSSEPNGYEYSNGSITAFDIKSIDFRPVLSNWDVRHPYNESYSNFFRTFDKYSFRSPKLEKAYYNGRPNQYNYGFMRYIKKYFRDLKPFGYLYDYQSYEYEYIAISFANLKAGLSKGIISFDNIYDMNQIQKISEYKIAPNSK